MELLNYYVDRMDWEEFHNFLVFADAHANGNISVALLMEYFRANS